MDNQSWLEEKQILLSQRIKVDIECGVNCDNFIMLKAFFSSSLQTTRRCRESK